MSLGFGGHVTVDLGGCVSDVPGNDLRIYQSVSSEPLSVYVSTSPEGPFTLLQPFFQDCGATRPGRRREEVLRVRPRVGRREPKARYVRVEDAEIYPCPCGTPSEGADLDAVQALALSTAIGRDRRRGRALSPGAQRPRRVSPASSSPRSRQAPACPESAERTRRSWRIARAAMPDRR